MKKMEETNSPEDRAGDFINSHSPLLIASLRECSWNVKILFVSLEHIFLVQNISKREYKNYVVLPNIFQMVQIPNVTDYHVGIDEQKFSPSMS